MKIGLVILRPVQDEVGLGEYHVKKCWKYEKKSWETSLDSHKGDYGRLIDWGTYLMGGAIIMAALAVVNREQVWWLLLQIEKISPSA